MLTVSALAASHGPVRALRGVALTVGPGALVALLGGNGAGKTTLLNAVAGWHRPVRGVIQFRGVDLVRLGPAQVLRRGLVLVPARPGCLEGLSVAENLGLGAGAGRGRASAMLARVFALFPELAELRDQPAGRLEPDAQRLLAIGRAVMIRPRTLLLDEPTAGLSEPAREAVLAAIVRLHAAGIGILLAEQNAAAALALCDYGYVLQRGTVVAQGKPAELRETRAAMEAFLG